jgi:hypothetical protein
MNTHACNKYATQVLLSPPRKTVAEDTAMSATRPGANSHSHSHSSSSSSNSDGGNNSSSASDGGSSTSTSADSLGAPVEGRVGGRCYLVLVEENKPKEIIAYARSRGMEAKVSYVRSVVCTHVCD